MKVDYEWWRNFFDEDYLRFWVGLDSERTAQEIQGLEKMLQFKEEEKLLDVPSGQGRHAIPLSLRKLNVTAMDISDFMLNKIREKKEDLNIELVNGDMREIPFTNHFDHIISMFSPIGYFQKKQEDIKFLKSVRNALKDKGHFVMDSRHRDSTVIKTQKKSFWEYDNTVILEEWDFEPLSGVRSSRLKWLENDIWTEKKSASIYYTATEILEMIEEAGFRIIETYGDYSLNPFTINSSMLVIHAAKN